MSKTVLRGLRAILRDVAIAAVNIVLYTIYVESVRQQDGESTFWGAAFAIVLILTCCFYARRAYHAWLTLRANYRRST